MKEFYIKYKRAIFLFFVIILIGAVALTASFLFKRIENKYKALLEAAEYKGSFQEFEAFRDDLNGSLYGIENKLSRLDYKIDETQDIFNRIIIENEILRKQMDSILNTYNDYSDQQLLDEFARLYKGG